MNMLRSHWPALILAFIVGLIMVGPQLVFIWTLGNSYQGLYMMQSDAEPHYLARMKEACDSGSIGNPYIKAYQNVYPSALYTYSEEILATPACLGLTDVPTLNLIYKFLLPALLTLLVYAFCFRLTKRRLWSFAGATLVLLGGPLVNLPDISNFIHWNLVYNQFATYARPINPEFSGLFFWTYLHLLLSVFRNPSRHLYVWLGIVLGASFYVYFYLFTFLICLTVVGAFYRRGLILALVIGAALGSPAIMALRALTTNPWYAGLSGEYGLAHTHMPTLSMAWLVVAVLLVAYLWRTKVKLTQSPDMSLLVVLVVTALAVINTQVLTGAQLQAGHYHWYFDTPIFLVVIVALASFVLASAKPMVQNFLATALVLLSVYSSVFVQYSSYLANASTVAGEQSLMQDLRKLNAGPSGIVVPATRPMSLLVPIYTSDYVTWDDYAGGYLLPPEFRKLHETK